jgi:hypothetical protein
MLHADAAELPGDDHPLGFWPIVGMAIEPQTLHFLV